MKVHFGMKVFQDGQVEVSRRAWRGEILEELEGRMSVLVRIVNVPTFP